MDERRNYIARIIQTALLFRDMYEEGNDGENFCVRNLIGRTKALTVALASRGVGWKY